MAPMPPNAADAADAVNAGTGADGADGADGDDRGEGSSSSLRDEENENDDDPRKVRRPRPFTKHILPLDEWWYGEDACFFRVVFTPSVDRSRAKISCFRGLGCPWGVRRWFRN